MYRISLRAAVFMKEPVRVDVERPTGVLLPCSKVPLSELLKRKRDLVVPTFERACMTLARRSVSDKVSQCVTRHSLSSCDHVPRYVLLMSAYGNHGDFTDL